MVSVTSLPTCPETNGLGGPSEARDRQLLSHRCLEVDVLLGSRRFVWKSTFCSEVDVLFGSRCLVRKSTLCLEVDVSFGSRRSVWKSPFQGWKSPFQGWESPFQGWESPYQGWKTPFSGSGVVGPKTAQNGVILGGW